MTAEHTLTLRQFGQMPTRALRYLDAKQTDD
jgi:hypothetical protein